MSGLEVYIHGYESELQYKLNDVINLEEVFPQHEAKI